MEPKKLLATLYYCQSQKGCGGCPGEAECGNSSDFLEKESAKVIERLMGERDKAIEERDAALYDMHQLQGATCAYCKNLYRPDGADHVKCREFGDLSRFYDGVECSPLICGKFAWRGVCAENTRGA